MEIMTVSELSRKFQVSTRMLRHYEKMGLLASHRKEDYAYRVYDEIAVKRLQQIIILRKLRVPLKQIAVILDDHGQSQALRILRENITELDDEIIALDKIREILRCFVSRLDECIRKSVRLDLLEDSELLKVVDALSLSKVNFKEEWSMEELNKASEVIESRMDIRIVYLPQATVAASQHTGNNPEDLSGARLESFIKSVNLPEKKQDFRVYGFNNPSPQEGQEHYGYEFWSTIPEDLDIPTPLEKKHFAGGLYAAHCIKMGDFQEWAAFFEVMKKDEEYEIDWREPDGMAGCLEEHLNVYSLYTGVEKEFKQIDLLIPVKKKV